MTRAWRLVKWEWRHEAMTGEGSRRYGGRWNPKGWRVVYMAESPELAVLEMWVHLDAAEVNHHLALIRVEIPDSLRIREVSAATLPAGWNRKPPPASTRRLGETWLKQAKAPLLRVPSVLVPHATNLLLAPEHPQAVKVVVSDPERYRLDLRMLKGQGGRAPGLHSPGERNDPSARPARPI